MTTTIFRFFRINTLKPTSVLRLCFIWFFMGCVITTNYAQQIPQNKNKLKRLAQQYFDNEQFDKALPLFLKLDSIEPNLFETKYYIGACYLNSSFDKTKGIPYLEYALKHGEKLLPNLVFYDLAKLYHLNSQFDEAIEMLKIFLSRSTKTDIFYLKAQQLLKNCINAKELIAQPNNIEIEKLPPVINTYNSEQNPFISADESRIFFTRTFYEIRSNIEFESQKKIMVAVQNGKSYEVREIQLNNYDYFKSKISLAGVSPDGEVLFFAIGTDNNADLYACKLTDEKCTQLIKLPDIINSPYNESSISVSPDGRTYYFSSNRPGGYGGKDIYRAVMDDNDQWSVIENLGPSVNTEFDEDAPYIHPDNRTLYFSSNGHNSMGGYDIFVAQNIHANEWKYPTNIGPPINTPSDDIGFVLSADGNSAYFSSSQSSDTKHDIYKAILHKTIPLTLVKGTIMGGEPPKPIKAKIRVIDNETKQPVKYVYSPNILTGKYLMIFPPNKNYDMVIEAEGYLPQLVNIYVPNQTYFYELYQEIYLKQIKISKNDSAIGQEIRISNTFYDVYKTNISDSILKAEQQKRQKHVDELLKIVENIIVATDSIELERLEQLTIKDEQMDKDQILKERYNQLLFNLEQAIEKTDSVTLQLLDANAIYNDVTNSTFFYGIDSDNRKMTKVLIGNDTIYTLPSISTSKPLQIKTPTIVQLKSDSLIRNIKKEIDFRTIPENKRRYIYINYVYYPSGKYQIEKKYIPLLNDIYQLISLNSEIGVEINGYTDPIGDEQKNLELSRLRAMNVWQYFIDRHLSPRRFVVTGKGEMGAEDISNYPQMRRTEIKLFEVIK